MTTLQKQAKKALPIIEAIIKGSDRVRVGRKKAECGYESLSLGHFLDSWTLAPIEFPALPLGEEWHNPQKISAEQMQCDKGWRPLLKSETVIPDDAQFFEPFAKKWMGSNYCGKNIRATFNSNESYRTKKPFPEPAVEMTVAEIEKLIGKRVKIVKE